MNPKLASPAASFCKIVMETMPHHIQFPLYGRKLQLRVNVIQFQASIKTSTHTTSSSPHTITITPSFTPGPIPHTTYQLSRLFKVRQGSLVVSRNITTPLEVDLQTSQQTPVGTSKCIVVRLGEYRKLFHNYVALASQSCAIAYVSGMHK